MATKKQIKNPATKAARKKVATKKPTHKARGRSGRKIDVGNMTDQEIDLAVAMRSAGIDPIGIHRDPDFAGRPFDEEVD